MRLIAEEIEKIEKLLAEITLCHGLGDEESPCSIAAINLAMYGMVTDHIPACMSFVIGKWIITTQDRMPLEQINSAEWKALLPLAAGTGRSRAKEKIRLDAMIDYMWECLANLQPDADSKGYGAEWREMVEVKSAAAAGVAGSRIPPYAIISNADSHHGTVCDLQSFISNYGQESEVYSATHLARIMYNTEKSAPVEFLKQLINL